MPVTRSRRGVLWLATSVIAFSSGACEEESSCATAGTCAAGEALVGFVDGLPLARVDEINRGIAAIITKTFDPGTSGDERDYLVAFDSARYTPERAVDYYVSHPEVEWAIPNYVITARAW